MVRGQGGEPAWKQVKWRVTRGRSTGEVLDDTAILHGEETSDLKWIYEFPDGKGIRDIVTEFWFEPSEPKTRGINDGEWKRIMGDVVRHIPEQILFMSDGKVVSNFQEYNAADDLAEIFSPPR
eukprot:7229509-Pyramimonas_sp.AAC.1